MNYQNQVKQAEQSLIKIIANMGETMNDVALVSVKYSEIVSRDTGENEWVWTAIIIGKNFNLDINGETVEDVVFKTETYLRQEYQMRQHESNVKLMVNNSDDEIVNYDYLVSWLKQELVHSTTKQRIFSVNFIGDDGGCILTVEKNNETLDFYPKHHVHTVAKWYDCLAILPYTVLTVKQLWQILKANDIQFKQDDYVDFSLTDANGESHE